MACCSLTAVLQELHYLSLAALYQQHRKENSIAMKRTLGICLLVMGILSFLLMGWLFLNYMTLTPEIIIAHYGEEAKHYYKEGLDKHLHNGRIVSGTVTLLCLTTTFVGYRLSKSGKKKA